VPNPLADSRRLRTIEVDLGSENVALPNEMVAARQRL
jgi:hypothetical protein